MNIEISSLEKSYTGNPVLRIDELRMATDTIYGIVGPNGSGKSTLLYAILDLVEIDGGFIHIGGNGHTHSKSRKSIGFFVDKDRIIDFLTFREYLFFTGHSWGLKNGQILDIYREISDILEKNYLEDPALIRDYSDGNKQLAGILCALVARTPIVILDEPFNFLDHATCNRLVTLLSQWRDRYHTLFLISSNNLLYPPMICDTIFILRDGQIQTTLEKQEFGSLCRLME